MFFLRHTVDAQISDLHRETQEDRPGAIRNVTSHMIQFLLVILFAKFGENVAEPSQLKIFFLNFFLYLSTHNLFCSDETKEQTKQLEDVQRRALQVIFGNIPYDEVRRTHNIPTLAERRLDLSRTFFKRIIRDNSNVFWYLLPAKRDPQLTARLRCATCARQYSTIYARTNRYKNSLITYGLNHWQ